MLCFVASSSGCSPDGVRATFWCGKGGLGASHTCALGRDGETWCWGNKQALGVGLKANNRILPIKLSSLRGKVEDIQAASNSTCALLKDKTVKCWGSNSFGQLGDGTITERYVPTYVQGVDNAVSIANGGGYGNDFYQGYITCVILEDKTAKCWGRNRYGELGDQPDGGLGVERSSTRPVAVKDISDVKQVVEGQQVSCLLLENGTVGVWVLIIVDN